MHRRGSVLRAFKYSFAGLAAFWRNERNARIHLAVFVATIAASIFFQIDRWEWAVILTACFAVPAAEAFNSSIETLADRVTLEEDPAIKRCKDIASAAVLITCLGAVAVGVTVFGPRLLAFFDAA